MENDQNIKSSQLQVMMMAFHNSSIIHIRHIQSCQAKLSYKLHAKRQHFYHELYFISHFISLFSLAASSHGVQRALFN